ncbi:uncharacterized protein [Halyomorpha halys]|uniref:uncharacterized protein n=1 Tax=Halyomorpha halys TaxID=286706 RepID=UPI0006D4EB1F|nr:uncharacterized protein LOC106678096 [Halyomorpha halys]
MRAVFGLFLLVAASSAYVIGDAPLLGNDIDDLVTAALEYVRSLLIKHNPYSLPPMPNQHLVDTDVDLTISAHEAKIKNAGDFTIDKISNNATQLTASFSVTFPTPDISGIYNISGTAFQKKVEGKGVFVTDVNKLVQSGDIQFGIVNNSLQITSLNLDYSIGGIQNMVTGLTIDDLDEEDIDRILNNELLAYLTYRKPLVTEKVGAHIKEIVNALLNGKSVDEVIQWLKQLVASTPDPLPYTFPPSM